MRKTLLPLAFLGLAGSLWAADPIIGTWKLNVAKSLMPSIPQQALREETLVIREVEDYIEVTSTGIRMDGSPFSSKSTIPLQGGAAKYEQGAPAKGASVIWTRIDANTRYVTSLINGKQVSVLHSVVSKDGKTVQNTTKGIDAQGKPFERVTVFERQ
jgi:hypothetical protein